VFPVTFATLLYAYATHVTTQYQTRDAELGAWVRMSHGANGLGSSDNS